MQSVLVSINRRAFGHVEETKQGKAAHGVKNVRSPNLAGSTASASYAGALTLAAVRMVVV
jgi:hypothetical protein